MVAGSCHISLNMCLVQLYVVMVILELLVNQWKMLRMGVSEGELKCVSQEDMELFVMRNLVDLMLLWSVDNLAYHHMVKKLHAIAIQHSFGLIGLLPHKFNRKYPQYLWYTIA